MGNESMTHNGVDFMTTWVSQAVGVWQMQVIQNDSQHACDTWKKSEAEGCVRYSHNLSLMDYHYTEV